MNSKREVIKRRGVGHENYWGRLLVEHNLTLGCRFEKVLDFNLGCGGL